MDPAVSIFRIILVLGSFALIYFGVLYINRSFKTFNAVLELNKKMDEVINLLKSNK